MDIRNFTQFVAHLVTSQSVHKHPSFDKLMMCMMVYNSICICGGQGNSEKTSKHSECNRIYRECLGSIDGIKAYLFQQTSDNSINFYIDEVHLVKTIFR